jgi:hypothetical protein
MRSELKYFNLFSMIGHINSLFKTKHSEYKELIKEFSFQLNIIFKSLGLSKKFFDI